MLETLAVFFETTPLASPIFMGLIGLAAGSFLNVVIHRLPRMMEQEWRTQCAELSGQADAFTTSRFSLASPRSSCPHCGHKITALENIPLLSYCFLKGRCRACAGPISLRYPFVELISGVMTAAIAWRWGFSLQTLCAAFLTWSLVALSFIDIDTKYLPDSITLPFLWFGIACNYSGVFTDLESSVGGAMAGYLSLWIVYQLFKLATGKEGMGHGDFKLLAMLGGWIGWQAIPVIIVLSSFVGATIGITQIAFQGAGRGTPIPFGPYLACAGWISLLWGKDLVTAYMRWITVA